MEKVLNIFRQVDFQNWWICCQEEFSDIVLKGFFPDSRVFFVRADPFFWNISKPVIMFSCLYGWPYFPSSLKGMFLVWNVQVIQSENKVLKGKTQSLSL